MDKLLKAKKAIKDIAMDMSKPKEEVQEELLEVREYLDSKIDSDLLLRKEIENKNREEGGIMLEDYKYSICNLAKKTNSVHRNQIIAYAEKATKSYFKDGDNRTLDIALSDLECEHIGKGHYDITPAEDYL